MCDFDLSDLEPCDVWRETHRKAIKNHVCSACEANIPPGTKYLIVVVISDGSVNTSKACNDCEAAWEKFRSEHSSCSQPSYLAEMLSECVLWNDESAIKWQPALDALLKRNAEAQQ